MDDADRSGAVALGAQDGATHIEAASDREQEVMGERDKSFVKQGIWRGDPCEAYY